SFMNRFYQNPKATYNQRLQKFDGFGQPVLQNEAYFSEDEIKSRVNERAHFNMRKKLCTLKEGQLLCIRDMKPGKADFETGNTAEDLLELPQIIHSLSEMDR